LHDINYKYHRNSRKERKRLSEVIQKTAGKSCPELNFKKGRDLQLSVRQKELLHAGKDKV
jgi:hypothetical protein